jgi:hypothetical protein
MVRSAGTLPWLGFNKYNQTEDFFQENIIESMYCRVLHRPFEPTALIGQVPFEANPLVR